MKCEEVELKMIDYLDNTLDDITSKEIGLHINSCERCNDIYIESQEILKLVSEDKMEKPDDSVRNNFYHMLNTVVNKDEFNNDQSFRKDPVEWYNRSYVRVAAGFLILICGTFLGLSVRTEISKSETKKELAQLHTEISYLKKAALFTLGNQESSSDRIQALSYADDINNPDVPIIEVLVKTLNTDKNVNVRLAAAYALAKFADQPAVCDSLVKSLDRQDDPILQITLINMLVDRKERSAIEPINQIINNKKTLKEVRAIAESGIKTLI